MYETNCQYILSSITSPGQSERYGTERGKIFVRKKKMKLTAISIRLDEKNVYENGFLSGLFMGLCVYAFVRIRNQRRRGISNPVSAVVL